MMKMNSLEQFCRIIESCYVVVKCLYIGHLLDSSKLLLYWKFGRSKIYFKLSVIEQKVLKWRAFVTNQKMQRENR